jgi:hypothetical protein
MASAKQNLELRDTSSPVSGRKEADIPLTISAGLKIHALGKGNLLSDLRRSSQVDKQGIEIKVANLSKQPQIESQEVEKKAVNLHSSSQIENREIEKKVAKAQLINQLNFVNFQDGTILINLKHCQYEKEISLKATPQPCISDLVECLWVDGKNIDKIIESYLFRNILIPNGQKLLKVVPELLKLDEKGISLLLPESGTEITSRKDRRYACQGISAQLIQNSSVFAGELMDFNGYSFNVKVKAVPPQTFEWLNPEHPANIILSDGSRTLYTGECKVVRNFQGRNTNTRNFILKPIKQEIQRFKQKEYRSERYKLTPSPNIAFQHPFTKRMVDLKVVDLSGSGFSVEEDERRTALLPGMVLPKLSLNFSDNYKIECSAQVVYRKAIVESDGTKWIKSGLALLDMDIQDHLKLIALLHQTKNKHSYICSHVDLDALWKFFFETGFIYPDKYAVIQKNKKQIKETYAKIYTRNPHIARHFIYQDKGVIYGHMAMIRFYENAWMIHHHAARKSSANKAGLIVLDQIGRMINDSHRLYSLHMDYMICYYRSDNKFPSRVFGGAAKSIKDPKGCSLDGFAYFHFNNRPRLTPSLPENWQIAETQPEDLQELADFYEHTSGGLMLEAIDLNPEKMNCNDLSDEYRQLGLSRERHLYSLKQNGRLKAILLANLADIGLNLSEITNCIKVFVTNKVELKADILQAAISKVADITGKEDFPALLYPAAFADEQNISYDKIYNLWVCSLQYSDPYFRYLGRLLRFI